MKLSAQLRKEMDDKLRLERNSLKEALGNKVDSACLFQTLPRNYYAFSDSSYSSDKKNSLDQQRSELERRWDQERRALEAKSKELESELEKKEAALVSAVNKAAAEGDQKVRENMSVLFCMLHPYGFSLCRPSMPPLRPPVPNASWSPSSRGWTRSRRRRRRKSRIWRGGWKWH